MLARSASTPILNSWIPPQTLEIPSQILESTFPESDLHFHVTKSQFISLSSPCDSKKITRARSENDLALNLLVEDDTDKEESECDSKLLLFSSSGLGELVEEVGDGIGLGGGFGCNDGGGSSFGGEGFSDSNHDNENIDAYYKSMLKSDPGNALLLGNYARFLKEIRGDMAKAEEYCERALLEDPNDGNVKSLYADLIWEKHGDWSRAEKYHEQAVEDVPDDCYVMASYARFLWDAGDQEEEDDEEEEIKQRESYRDLAKPSTGSFPGVGLPSVSAY